MKVLKAIGAFFAKIGRWIKDTAWVQPLLIVGGIFAIIFSIKPISDAISNMFKGGNAAEDYYTQFKLSLEGAETGSSAADGLLNYLEDNTKGNYGNKFYLMFVSQGCDNCEACYAGYNLFQANFNYGSSFAIDSNKVGDGFKLYTIFSDERNDDGELLIDDLLRNHQQFFSDVLGETMQAITDNKFEVPFYSNTKSPTTYEDNIKSFYDCIGAEEDDDGVSLPSPATFLFDKTAGAEGTIKHNITQIFFNYTTDVTDNSDNFNKAYFLRDSWNYKGNFEFKD